MSPWPLETLRLTETIATLSKGKVSASQEAKKQWKLSSILCMNYDSKSDLPLSNAHIVQRQSMPVKDQRTELNFSRLRILSLIT